MDDDSGGLSAGRSRRSTAGNRMRELLEQERERLEAKRGNEDDEMFQEEEGDIDFEAKVEDVEDIIDSDFDQSSDDADEGDDGLEGEKEIEEEEKAAKKASRVKAAPIGVRKTVVPKAPSKDGQMSSVKPKRISFAPSTSTNQDGVQRSSKRKSTIDATLSVQARMKIEDQRRKDLIERAAPKRRRIRLSQADRIAEALEMEEQNRESLKRFLELEEERRERDRRRGKKEIDGPFLRFHSIAEDRNAHVRTRMIEEVIDSREADRANKVAASTRRSLTEDPVIAARDAAKKEREDLEAKDLPEHDKSDELLLTPTPHHASETEASGASSLIIADTPIGLKDIATNDERALSEQESADLPIAATSTPDVREPEVVELSDSSIVAPTGDQVENDVEMIEDNAKELLANATQGAEVPQETKRSIDATDTGLTTPDLDTIEMQMEVQPEERNNLSTPQKDAERDQISIQVEEDHPEDLETKTYISLHHLAPENPWHVNWSYILGSHVDWSHYPLVPARNRPLRPRQSICPITGLPAVYKDPRSGIAYANKEAYQILTKLMAGQYLWSSQAISESLAATDQQSSISTNYEPLEMGCWLDLVNEVGACNVISLASNQASTSVVPGFVPKGAVAPGDEQALVAAAQALPAGTTRSGGRRSANASTQ